MPIRRLLVAGLVAGVLGPGLAVAQDGQPKPTTKSEWARQTRTAVALPYPDLSRFEGIGGDPTSLVEIEVRRDGTVEGAKLKRSSSVPLLDEAALAMARGTDDIPPFTPDMKGERITVVAPFVFRLDAPGRTVRLFVDTRTGLRLELPAPLSVIRPRRDETGAVSVDVSADGFTSDADPNEPARLCNLSIEPWPAGEARDQAVLNEPARVENRARLDEEAMRESGYDPVARTVATHKGAALLTVESQGTVDGSNKGWILWNMTAARPEGRVSLLCRAAEEEAESARNIIRRVLAGVDVVPR